MFGGLTKIAKAFSLKYFFNLSPPMTSISKITLKSFNKLLIMSDSEGGEEEPKRDINEVREEVKQKLLESFQAFDTEGTG